ncbi:hypothetical protein J4573_50995 [Actinomadura barringtoniae]|uniref:Uncharacterized protein n=1 Tax=Actinomadura barringtoniae TaxID=1427535 RepID=A0A939PMF9_9ACTN|nr:hypothetical protein [Actinomadura barringtoniae]MBO2455486.1 hypothetical protein [Actinomadura barringtoniae]
MSATPEQESGDAPSLDDVLVGEAVLGVYRQMFAALARDGGAVVDDPELVDVAETLLAAFADAGEDGLSREQMRYVCRRYPNEVFENRLRVLKGLGAIREVFPKPNQLRYRASFTSVVGLMFVRRMMLDGGQSEMHRLLALEQLNVADPRMTPDQARAGAEGLARAFRLWSVELLTLTNGTIEELREQAPKLWGTEEILIRAERLHGAILRRWPQLDRTCTELRAAIYAYGDASRRAAARLSDSAGTTRNLTLLPPETWRTFARTATRDDLAAVLDGFVFDAAAPWHEPAAVVTAVEDGPRATPPRPAPPRPSVPDHGLSDETGGDRAALERLREIAEQVLRGRDRVAVEEVLDRDWVAGRRMLADLSSVHLHPELPYRLVWSDGLAVRPDGAPTWMSPGVFERTGPS